MMRSTLEARLLVAAPAEMLIARPISRHTERLLGGFSLASNGLRTVTAEGSKYKEGGALAAVTGFYASKGEHQHAFHGAPAGMPTTDGLILVLWVHLADRSVCTLCHLMTTPRKSGHERARCMSAYAY